MTDRLIYCDGVSSMSVTGGMVRIDLTALSPTQRDSSNRPLVEFRGQVVMPPDAFLQAFDLMQKFVNELKEKGVIAMNVSPTKTAASP